MAQYHSLSKELQERILEDREKHKKNPYAFPDEKIVRRRSGGSRPPTIKVWMTKGHG